MYLNPKKAGQEIITLHGKENVNKLLPILESHLKKIPSNQSRFRSIHINLTLD